MSDLDFAELRLIDHYRAQTEALEKLTRWHLMLLDTPGVSTAEATAICSDLSEAALIVTAAYQAEMLETDQRELAA